MSIGRNFGHLGEQGRYALPGANVHINKCTLGQVKNPGTRSIYIVGRVQALGFKGQVNNGGILIQVALSLVTGAKKKEEKAEYGRKGFNKRYVFYPKIGNSMRAGKAIILKNILPYTGYC